MNQDKLLAAIIDITSQRDHDALGNTLMSILIGLVPITRTSLYRILNENVQHILEEVVCFESQKNDSNEFKQTQSDTPRIIEASDRIKSCITKKEVFWQDSNHDQYSKFLAPIFYKNTVIGILALESDHQLSNYHHLIQDIIKIYENCIFSLNESEQDTLTGLRNRRTFDLQLSKLLEKLDIAGNKKITSNNNERRFLESKTASWLVTMDIDHFKRVNDNYGHVYGDEVLLMLSQMMKKTFRDTDLLFRFGGEEFVIILTTITEDNAFLVLERFRETIADYTFPKINQVTISIGYAMIQHSDFPITILDKADKALYYAKENGRNQVYCYEKLVREGKLKEETITQEVELF